jgi:hypothetical protein
MKAERRADTFPLENDSIPGTFPSGRDGPLSQVANASPTIYELALHESRRMLLFQLNGKEKIEEMDGLVL